jgi:hypothetical protein
MNFYNSYNMGVAATYIISLPGNKISEDFTSRCFQSCLEVGQPNPLIVPGFDASEAKVKLQDYQLGQPVGEIAEIKVPEALQGQAFINFLRLRRADMLATQIACFLSHYSLWCLCLAMDKPIVILEHDAIMVKPYHVHKYYNNIVYLGSKEQYKHGTEVYSIPPHASDHKGLDRFICRAHAYAIDPAIAKNMVSYVIQQGITTSLDIIIRSDMFGIVQDGIYAYDDNMGLSTITEDGRAVG